MKRRNLIVVDDFLDNPDAVREYALEQTFERLGGKNWPGRDSSDTHGQVEMTQACSAIVGQQLVIKPEVLQPQIIRILRNHCPYRCI